MLFLAPLPYPGVPGTSELQTSYIDHQEYSRESQELNTPAQVRVLTKPDSKHLFLL